MAPPRTILEVFKILPEGTLAEIIENTLYMSPAPSPYHQFVVVALVTALKNHVSKKEGMILVSPVDLYLDEFSNAVQPDILFISSENPMLINNTGLHGVPDLIIEILSPGNRNHDRVIKKALYEKFGVKEYWIVDPETKQSTGYALVEGAYEQIAIENEKLISPLLKGTFSF